MKKIVLTMAAVMTFTLGFAETKTNNAEQRVDNFVMNFDKIDEMRFDMSFDMRRLAAKLDLTEEQMDAVEAIQNCFNNEMQSLATMRGFHRRHLVHQAVRKDVRQMQHVLNDKQFNTYMILLGTTLHNKGL